jgi:hypothetical protein
MFRIFQNFWSSNGKKTTSFSIQTVKFEFKFKRFTWTNQTPPSYSPPTLGVDGITSATDQAVPPRLALTQTIPPAPGGLQR